VVIVSSQNPIEGHSERREVKGRVLRKQGQPDPFPLPTQWQEMKVSEQPSHRHQKFTHGGLCAPSPGPGLDTSITPAARRSSTSLHLESQFPATTAALPPTRRAHSLYIRQLHAVLRQLGAQLTTTGSQSKSSGGGTFSRPTPPAKPASVCG
jgi:hypothetical protein